MDRRSCQTRGLGSPTWLAATVLAIALPAQACWQQAATRYGIPADLLRAIARTESGMNPQAVGHNAGGSRDIGLMQINSSWLPRLAVHGIREEHLFDPCTSIQVGAWILAHNVRRLGYTWEAVGAYNATQPARRRAYAERVARQLEAVRSAPLASIHVSPTTGTSTTVSTRAPRFTAIAQ